MSDTEIIILRGGRHVVTDCGVCGVTYTVPEVVYNHHWQEGGYHHCPNGHTWGWAKDGTERERLRRERDRLKQRIAEKDDEIAERDRQLIASKGQITKLKKRVSHGVCLECNRTFSNVARHMQTKHPEAFKCETVN